MSSDITLLILINGILNLKNLYVQWTPINPHNYLMTAMTHLFALHPNHLCSDSFCSLSAVRSIKKGKPSKQTDN